ncbi:MAG: 3-dehydroquinate synthase, partial [Gemmatimonadetes bacterium]|nr:3-dehydroquinate synthase [Gemmatimonadota bacterium]
MKDANTTYAPIKQLIRVSFDHLVEFTTGLFQSDNAILRNIVEQQSKELPRKILFIIDNGVADHHPDLISEMTVYCERHKDILNLVTDPLIIPGGEACKNDPAFIKHLRQKINQHGIDRHSYVVAIGGGAVLDLVGYVAATAHRGVRHIRVPTTVLSQNDSGVGVKNGVNAFGKKNFIGTFAPPAAVICDFDFLITLSDRDWIAGIAEAVKVALLKDHAFFNWIQEKVPMLVERDLKTMHRLIHQCAKWHVDHIGTYGDPFETGSARPLDFGHWVAHKLEQLSDYKIRHGEAVAIGISLDTTYSHLTG